MIWIKRNNKEILFSYSVWKSILEMVWTLEAASKISESTLLNKDILNLYSSFLFLLEIQVI